MHTNLKLENEDKIPISSQFGVYVPRTLICEYGSPKTRNRLNPMPATDTVANRIPIILEVSEKHDVPPAIINFYKKKLVKTICPTLF